MVTQSNPPHLNVRRKLNTLRPFVPPVEHKLFLFTIEVWENKIGGDSLLEQGKIEWHLTVVATDERVAFERSQEVYRVHKGDGFPYLFTEFVETVPDYFWVAEDGSRVWIEIRKVFLGE